MKYHNSIAVESCNRIIVELGVSLGHSASCTRPCMPQDAACFPELGVSQKKGA